MLDDIIAQEAANGSFRLNTEQENEEDQDDDFDFSQDPLTRSTIQNPDMGTTF